MTAREGTSDRRSDQETVIPCPDSSLAGDSRPPHTPADGGLTVFDQLGRNGARGRGRGAAVVPSVRRGAAFHEAPPH